jgi:outer membrane protein TolC
MPMPAEKAGRSSLRSYSTQYVPDFSLSASTDLGGVVQNLSGMVTVPLLRYQAISAAVAQAEANLRATGAMRRQTGIDLRSKVIAAVTVAHDLRRQLALLENNVIPRAEAMTTINQSAYESGRVTLAEMLDSRRSLTAPKRLDANLRVSYEERLFEIEGV